jgi:hypothetical protein
MAELDPMIVRSEIHDGLSQDLSALGFAACALRLRLAELDDPILTELSARVETLTETASTTVRALYRHFERGATGGLVDALATMSAELEESAGTQLWIRVDGELGAGAASPSCEPLVEMTRAAVVALAPAGGRAWLVLAPGGDRSRIEVRTDHAIEHIDADTRAQLDDCAEPIAATWSLDRDGLTIVI